MSDLKNSPIEETNENVDENVDETWTKIEKKNPVRRQKKSKYQNKNKEKYQPKSRSRQSDTPREEVARVDDNTHVTNRDESNHNEKTDVIRTRQPNQYYRSNNNRRNENRQNDSRPSRFARSTPESEEEKREQEKRDQERQEYKEAISLAESKVLTELMLNKDFLEDKLADCEFMINPRTGSGYRDYRLSTDKARRINSGSHNRSEFDERSELDDRILVNGRSFSRSHFYSNRNFRQLLQDRYWDEYKLEMYFIRNTRRDRNGNENTIYLLKFPINRGV